MPLGSARFGLSGADLGKLQLIQTQTVSGVSSVDFTSIKGSEYNVHFLTYSNVKLSAGNKQIGMRFYESGTLETASVYRYAYQYGTSTGTFGEDRSTGATRIYTVNFGATHNTGVYIYLYNLGNSSKYSFLTYQGNQALASYNTMFFGGGVLPQASTVDGFRVYLNTGTITGEYKLYGVKQI